MQNRNLTMAFCLACILLAKAYAFAMGGTSIVATKGKLTRVSPGWPKGVGELVNDKLRTTGWQSWFSEWPNDVNQYAFEIKSTDDLNRLVHKLEAIESDLRHIHLSHLLEPNGLGWVTRVPKGNGIPVVFSIGDQARIDEWFKRLRKPFGKMEFMATPVAVPPTLTVFVRNDSVNLDELVIPRGIKVSAGYVPTVFHKSNTKTEKLREKETAKRDAHREFDLDKQKLDELSLTALNKIEAFLDSRMSSTSDKMWRGPMADSLRTRSRGVMAATARYTVNTSKRMRWMLTQITAFLTPKHRWLRFSGNRFLTSV